MQTIVELSEYLRQAAAVLGEDEKAGIINTLARNPTAGVVVTGTGGIRKLRYFVRIMRVKGNEQSI